jgi:hypothetical protein
MNLNIEQRITRLEDIEAVRGIITQFARGADAGCDPGILRPIFTDDAVFRIAHFGTLEGGDIIAREMHANAAKGFNWTIHYLTTPTVEIGEDLESARCFFYLWEVATHPSRDGSPKAYWIGGWYDGVAVKQHGRWRFRRLELTLGLMTPHEPGWRPIPRSFEDL